MLRIERFHRAVFSSCLVLFLSIPGELQAQTERKESTADLIQCSIEMKTDTWSQGKPIFVVVQLKNISVKDTDFLGIYTFELRGLPRMYWSPVNIKSGAPLKLETTSDGLGKGGGRVPKAAIHLQPGETKAMTFDLSKLFWNESFSSVWPCRKLFEVVSKGNYDLAFVVETGWRTNSDNITDVTHIASNRVRILIE